MSDNPLKDSMNTELSISMAPEMSHRLLQTVCNDLIAKCSALEKALLWVIYEQCVYGGKAYAKLLIHGEDAFRLVDLKDGCDVQDIEKKLFGR